MSSPTIDPKNPHDGLFRFTLSNKKRARLYLRSILQGRLAKELDWKALQLDPTSFVSAELEQRYSDILYSIPLRGKPAFIYVLLEHQSEADRWMPLRLLEYMVAIWVRWLADNPKAETLPVVIPIVLSHVEGGWNTNTRFCELFDAELVELIGSLGILPDFRCLLDDLAQQSDEVIKTRLADAFTALALLLLRNARTSLDLATWMEITAPELLRQMWKARDGRTLLSAVLQYIFMVARNNEPSDFHRMIDAVLDKEATNMSTLLGETIVERSERKGRLEGERKGKREGERKGIAPLLRLFGRKLGRSLTEGEQDELVARLDRLGPERLGDVALDFDAAQLDAWLADQAAC